jgi:hypothetical protein
VNERGETTYVIIDSEKFGVQAENTQVKVMGEDGTFQKQKPTPSTQTQKQADIETIEFEDVPTTENIQEQSTPSGDNMGGLEAA